jgi:hypothetical protein
MERGLVAHGELIVPSLTSVSKATFWAGPVVKDSLSKSSTSFHPSLVSPDSAPQEGMLFAKRCTSILLNTTVILCLGTLVVSNCFAIVCINAQSHQSAEQVDLTISTLRRLGKDKGVLFEVGPAGGKMSAFHGDYFTDKQPPEVEAAFKASVAGHQMILKKYQEIMPPDEYMKTWMSGNRHLFADTQHGGGHEIVVKMKTLEGERVVAILYVKRAIVPYLNFLTPEGKNSMPHLKLLEDERVNADSMRSFYEMMHEQGVKIFEMGTYMIDDQHLTPTQYKQVRKALWQYFYNEYFAGTSTDLDPHGMFFVFDVYGEDRKDSTLKLSNGMIFPKLHAFGGEVKLPHYVIGSFGNSFKQGLQKILGIAPTNPKPPQ